MISKIAIYRALYLGDMLCIIPAVRAIRARYPRAEIFLIGLPWQNEFVARFPRYFNHFVEFPGWPGLPEQKPDASAVIGFLQRMQSHNFDIIFQMQGNGVLTNSMCMLWNGKKVCGLRREGEYSPDEQSFPVSEDSDHEVLRFFKLLDCVGIPPQGSQLEFPVMKVEEARAKQMLRNSRLTPYEYLCIHPGARDPRRRWSADNFARITKDLAIQGFPVVLTGSSDEQDLLADVKVKAEVPVLNIVERFGHVGIGELAALLQYSRLLVSNDTGVSHVAAALGVPSVVLFSMHSTLERWRPLNELEHIAIPFDKSLDYDYVLLRIRQQLMVNNPENARGHAVG